jgi:curved DNA-binding protein CbpA
MKKNTNKKSYFMEDYYVILGIAQSATPEEIKKKYRELAKLYHPDKNSTNPSSMEFFKKIQAAYETLSDPGKRASYDLQQKELSNPAPQTKPNDILTEAFISAGMWIGFGQWIVSKLEKRINKE